MKKALAISIRFTLITTVMLGIAYPLVIAAFAHVAMRDKADGQLVSVNGKIIGSRIIGQSFTADRYFHGRPSAAGNGYDASSSGGSNLASSSQKLITRMTADVAKLQQDAGPQAVPIDLVTTSASGLDPDITPAAAYYQVLRISRSRNLSESSVRALVTAHIQQRQFGFLGEPRVNVLELNLALDKLQ